MYCNYNCNCTYIFTYSLFVTVVHRNMNEIMMIIIILIIIIIIIIIFIIIIPISWKLSSNYIRIRTSTNIDCLFVLIKKRSFFFLLPNKLNFCQSKNNMWIKRKIWVFFVCLFINPYFCLFVWVFFFIANYMHGIHFSDQNHYRPCHGFRRHLDE